MATAGVTHHLRLSQSDGSTTEQGIMLARDRDRNLLYRAQRLPSLPLQDIWVEQKSWHRGFGDYLYRREDPYRYAYSDGVDCRFAGGAQLVNAIGPIQLTGSPLLVLYPLDFGIRNPHAEVNDTTMWTIQGGASIARSTSNLAAASDNHWRVTTAAQANSGVYQSLTNPTVYQGREITIHFAVGSSIADVKAFIQDDAGTTAGTAITADGQYRWASATRTIDAAATFVRVGVRTDAGAASGVIDMENGCLVPTGGATVVSMMEYAGALYAAIGRVIAVWDETNDVWDAVLIDDSETFTSLVVHGAYIYAAHGAGYSYSNDTSGARTTWTDVTPSAGAADFLAQALDASGTLRLVRADKPNSVYISNESAAPVGAANWATAYTAGESDKDITGLFSAFDSVLVGREDGLYYFYPPDNLFRSATDQFKLAPDAENFDRGAEFIDGFFYTSMARVGQVRLRIDGGDFVFEQVSPRYTAPYYNLYGSRLRAFAHDGTWLYGLMEDNLVLTSANKEAILFAARNENVSGSQQLVWNTLKTIRIRNVKGMLVDSDYLYMYGDQLATAGAGTVPVQATFYRMTLPAQHENMLKEPSPAVRTRGTLVTSIMDMGDEGYGVDDKGLTKVVVYGNGVDASNTITVEVQVDTAISDTGSWTAVGAAITSLTNGASTVSFTAGSGSTGKRFRLRFTLIGTATSSPILRGFRVYAVPHPDRYWAWDFTMRVSNTLEHLNGTRGAETAQNVMANMNTLDAQDFPLKFNDLDNTQYNAQIVSMEKVAVPGQGTRAGTSGEHLEQALHVVMREVLTS